MRAAHKAPIRVDKDVPGFVGNRLQAALLREALYLVETGVTTAQGVDDAVRFGFGFRFMACGPMKQREFAGWDGHLRSGNTLYGELCASGRHGEMLHRMVAEGKLGLKTRQGFWTYTEEQVESEKRDYERKLLAAFEMLRPELEP
jgi:3-hydroxybutyryl-CoA dehydrogenase